MSIKNSIQTLETSLDNITVSLQNKGISMVERERERVTLSEVADLIRQIQVSKETIAHIINIPEKVSSYNGKEIFCFIHTDNSYHKPIDSIGELNSTSFAELLQHSTFYDSSLDLNISEQYQETKYYLHVYFTPYVNLYPDYNGSWPVYFKAFQIQPGKTFECDFTGYSSHSENIDTRVF